MKKSRRNFIKNSLVVLSAAPIVASLEKSGLAPDLISLAHAEGGKALSLEHPQAKALGYAHDGTKVDTAKFPKKGGEDGAKQKCSNCQLMTQGGLKVDGQEGEWGKCALFPDGLVNLNGWCNSWVLKA